MEYKMTEMITPSCYQSYKEKEFARTPKHYQEFKKKYPDAVLLFRCGDFYETYADDAQECGRILDIAVSNYYHPSRNYRIAGFPFHKLDIYLPKLIRAGMRVAIIEQT